MERPGELVEVEVDDDLPPDPAAPVGVRTPSRAARRRRAMSVAAMGAALVTALGVVLATGAEQRAGARDDVAVRTAGLVPGTVGSLREPLRDAWQIEGRLVGSAGGLVLVEEGEPVDLVARTPAGERVWRVPVPGSRDAGLRCPADLGAGSVVVCEVPGRAVTAPNTSAELVQQPARLVLLGSTDGAVRQAWTLPAGTLGWGVLDDDAVAVVLREDRHLVVRRLEPGAREPRWTARVPLPEGTSTRSVAVDVRPDGVVVTGAVGLVVSADGSVQGPWLPQRGTAAVDVVPTELGAVVWRAARSGGLERLDGAGGPTVVGQPARVPVDDGSEPGVLLVLDGTPDVVRAVDLESGAVLWERPGRASDLLVRMDGSLVLIDGRDAVSVTLRSGEERWRAAAGGPDTPFVPALTDGVRLLLPTYTAATGRALATVRLDDGDRSWEAPLPAGVWRTGAVGEVVVAAGRGRVVVLSAPSTVGAGGGGA